MPWHCKGKSVNKVHAWRDQYFTPNSWQQLPPTQRVMAVEMGAPMAKQAAPVIIAASMMKILLRICIAVAVGCNWACFMRAVTVYELLSTYKISRRLLRLPLRREENRDPKTSRTVN